VFRGGLERFFRTLVMAVAYKGLAEEGACCC
jgi:hypothetical protein